MTFHGMWNIDKVMRERYFPDYEHKGVFLDIGAGHPHTISNSRHFKDCGWKVYAIEANPRLAQLHIDDGNTTFIGAVGSYNGTVEFDSYANDLGWGGNISATPCNKGEELVKIEVPIRTIDSLLENEFKKITTIDLVSMDIELYEPEALRGWTSLPKYKPSVVCVEIQGENEVFAIMDSYGYKFDSSEADLDYFFIPK